MKNISSFIKVILSLAVTTAIVHAAKISSSTNTNRVINPYIMGNNFNTDYFNQMKNSQSFSFTVQYTVPIAEIDSQNKLVYYFWPSVNTQTWLVQPLLAWIDNKWEIYTSVWSDNVNALINGKSIRVNTGDLVTLSISYDAPSKTQAGQWTLKVCDTTTNKCNTNIYHVGQAYKATVPDQKGSYNTTIAPTMQSAIDASPYVFEAWYVNADLLPRNKMNMSIVAFSINGIDMLNKIKANNSLTAPFLIQYNSTFTDVRVGYSQSDYDNFIKSLGMKQNENYATYTVNLK